jgi:hypothetical protein
MKVKSQFLDQQKFQDKHEHAILFFFKNKKWDQVCVNVSPTPPNLNYTLSPMCVKHGKILPERWMKLSGIGLTQSIPPKLELKHTCP